MQKIIFAIFLLIAAGNLGCGNTGLMQNQDAANLQPNLTTSPTPTNGRPSKEFLEHYDKGVKLSTDFSIPDNLTKAIEEFKKAAEIEPTKTIVYWRMAELYDKLKDYDGVANCYRQILKRNPKELNAQYGLARVLVEDSKNYNEGLKEALIAKEKDASYSWAIEEILGRAYEGLGDIPNAIKQYKAYLKDLRDLKSTNTIQYKDMQKKVAELEKTVQTSKTNQNSNSNQR